MVIPTFSPSTNLLTLLDSFRDLACTVVVADDSSPCTSDTTLRAAAALNSVSVIRHRRNAGVARGLNDGLAAAVRSSAPWLLTVDQDSQLTPAYLDSIVSAAQARVATGEALGALGAEVIFDTSGGVLRYPKMSVHGLLRTEEVIQTGTLWNVEALESIGGFDETLGMDAVDAAACLGLRSAGYVIGLAEGLRLQHTIGSSRPVSIGGREVMVTGHSTSRRTSMMRNRLRLFPAEFAQSPRHAVRTIRRVGVNQALGLILEDDRWEKAKASIRGLGPRQSR